MRRAVFLTLIVFFTVTPLLAQPPAETCGAGDSLDGMDMLPIDLAATPTVDDFDMTGTNCSEQQFDHVTCFTPTSSCTVDATCTGDGERADDVLGLQVSVNVVEGACSTSPASCIDSDGGTGSGTVTGVALTGGTNYCFVCEVGFSTSIALQVDVVTGDCGSLPVELLDAEVD